MDLAGFEPAIFGLEVRRHIQAWLQVLLAINYILKYLFSFKFYYSLMNLIEMKDE